MPLSDQLLKKLVCPKCKGKLDYRKIEDRLVCGNCKLAFKVSNNVPVLLVDEAEKLS